MLKSQQRFRREKHNVFAEKVNNITLSTNNNKRIQSIDSIETYAYGTNKDLICRKAEINCRHIIKQNKKG